MPPSFPVTPATWHASRTTFVISPHTGSPNPMWATMPSPKKVSTRWRVRSKNWSGITKSSGLCSSFSEPTAETETMRSTPNCLKPCILARKFSSLGSSLWPRAWRARKATLRPSSVPRMYASEGSPKGVCCSTSCASVKPGMWYRPLPPIMPISACCKCAPDWGWTEVLEMTAELVIIQDGKSWLRGRGFFFRPVVCLHPLRRVIIQTFADQYRVAADFNHDGPLLRQPGVPAAQGSPGIHGRRVFRNFAVHSQRLALLIALGQRFRVHGRELRRFRRARPAGNVQHPDRRRFVCRFVGFGLPGKVIPTAPLRINSCSLLPARVLLNQNIDVKLSHGADIEGIVVLKISLHIDHLHRLHLLVRKVGLRLHDFARRLGRVLERARIGQFPSARLQKRAGKVESVAIRESQFLFQEDRSIAKRGRIRGPLQHALLERFDNLGRFEHRLSGRGQRIIEQHDHSLAFYYRLPSGLFLVSFDIGLTWNILFIISMLC